MKNNRNAENLLSAFLNGMNNMANSGLFPAGIYFSIERLSSIRLVMPNSVTQTISFTPKKILFLRLYPVYFHLHKNGFIQGVKFDLLVHAVCSHTAFLGHIKSRSFKYNASDVHKTVCSSCIALDYDQLKNVLDQNIVF